MVGDDVVDGSWMSFCVHCRAVVVVHGGLCGLRADTLDLEDLLAKDVSEDSAWGGGYST